MSAKLTFPNVNAGVLREMLNTGKLDDAPKSVLKQYREDVLKYEGYDQTYVIQPLLNKLDILIGKQTKFTLAQMLAVVAITSVLWNILWGIFTYVRPPVPAKMQGETIQPPINIVPIQAATSTVPVFAPQAPIQAQQQAQAQGQSQRQPITNSSGPAIQAKP